LKFSLPSTGQLSSHHLLTAVSAIVIAFSAAASGRMIIRRRLPELSVAYQTCHRLKHVIVVMLENHSYKQVVSNSSAPFPLICKTCGVPSMFGATHFSSELPSIIGR